ncbi:SLC5 family protein, partial [Shigella dysenteriae]|nr:SLC5 family protein [Shigella dysenteriae]
LPGLIAFHLYQDLPKADMAYPTLVNNVLPVPLVGFFGAVLFGAVISTFNGFLNSASTLFSMGIYRRIINQNAEPQQLVTVGRKFGFFIAIVSVLVAPWIANAPQGLYSWMKQLNGIYNVPLVTIIIMGFFFPRIPALAAKVAMGIGIISYITINYLVKFDFHFLYVLACTFCINVDMKPWKNVKIASIGILFAMIGVYAGLAEFGGYGTRWLAMISYFIAAVVIVYLIFDSWRHRHDPAVTFTPDAKDSL